MTRGIFPGTGRNPSFPRYHRSRTFGPEEITSLREKTLFVLGDRDPPTYRPEAMRILSDSAMNLKVVPGAGHALNHTSASEVEDLMISFLDGAGKNLQGTSA